MMVTFGRPRVNPEKTPVIRVEDELRYGRIPCDCFIIQVTTQDKGKKYTMVKSHLLTCSEAEAKATMERMLKEKQVESAAQGYRWKFRVQLLRVDTVADKTTIDGAEAP